MSARPHFTGPALTERLTPVLADLAFPARRWQVLTVADLYGVDTATRSLIEMLPERRYHAMAEVVGVLAAVLTGRPAAAVGTASDPPVPRAVHGPVRPLTPVA